MVQKENILDVVFKAIDEINQQLPMKQRVELSEDSALSHLSSLTVVTLIVVLEQIIEEDLGVSVVFGDQEAMFSEDARGVAKNVPITGKDIDADMAKKVDDLTKDRTKEYITPGETSITQDTKRKVDTRDRAQRGLNPEELEENKHYTINENQIRKLIRQSIRRNLLQKNLPKEV